MTGPSRNTPQRRLILSTIEAAAGPLTVQEILAAAQDNLPTLGIATVYRNVKLLHDSHHIEAHIFPDGTTRYEKTGHIHHHHFLCADCGRSFCFDSCPVQVGAVKLPRDFTVSHHELLLHGRCSDCV